MLNTCASLTNRTVPLDQKAGPRSTKTPKLVIKSQKALLKQHRRFNKDLKNGKNNLAESKAALNRSRSLHRKLERSFKAKDSISRDENLCSADLSSAFAAVRHSKRSKSGKIHKLTVDGKTYIGDSVKDGFYDSNSSLKTRDNQALARSKYFSDFSNDYLNILEVSKHL